MKNIESTPNNLLFQQKANGLILPQKPEPKPALISPSFFCPQPKNFGSNFSEKRNCASERINGFCSYNSGLEFDMLGHAFFRGMCPPFFSWPLNTPTKYQTKMYNIGEEENNNIKYDQKNFILECIPNGQEDYCKEKEKENENINHNKTNQNNNVNSSYLYNFINGNYNLKESIWTPENNINLNLNMNMITPRNSNNNTNNTGTKFFTNHNYGYKCSCSKTQCNRKYCECFNSGNYCIDCNCKNCNNKPPVNSYTNKHPVDDSSKNKKQKIICTCTKSGCNKNYCECFKNGQKCSSLCRCISCENNDDMNNKRNFNRYYECCPANSIYIIKNNITIENIKNNYDNENKNEENINYELSPAPARKENYIAISKKRKREETKISEEIYDKKNKNKEIDLFNDSLFDKNGKVILRHINLIQM